MRTTSAVKSVNRITVNISTCRPAQHCQIEASVRRSHRTAHALSCTPSLGIAEVILFDIRRLTSMQITLIVISRCKAIQRVLLLFTSVFIHFHSVYFLRPIDVFYRGRSSFAIPASSSALKEMKGKK